MSKKTCNPGKLPKLWDYLAELHKSNPEAFSSGDYLRAIVQQRWTALGDKEHCPNCKASMVAYWFEFDMPNAAMLVAMSRKIRENIAKGIPFHDANAIHVPSMHDASYAMKSRTTQMAKLGLIAKYTRNGHHVGGTWLITKRGWMALANHPVPKRVEVFRNAIIERDGEAKTTISQVFTDWSNKKRELQKRGKSVTTDYSGEVEEHAHHNDWVHLGDLQPGDMV